MGVGPAAAAKAWWLSEIRPRKPAASHVRTTISKNARAALSSIPPTIHGNKYRGDPRMAAVRRAGAILRSREPIRAGEEAEAAPSPKQ